MTRSLSSVRLATVIVLAGLAGLAACSADSINVPRLPAGAPDKVVNTGFLNPSLANPGTNTLVQNTASSRCLNIGGASTSPGAKLYLWDCVATASNELFGMGVVGTAAPITAYNGALCLSENSGTGAVGAALITAACTGASNQNWTLTTSGQLKHASGTCVVPNGGGTTNSTQIVLGVCTSASNQLWGAPGLGFTPPTTPPVLPPAPAGTNTLVTNTASTRCLNIGGASTSPGARLYLWDCVATATNEIFAVVVPGTSAPITVYNGALCLAESSGSGAAGAAVVTAACTNGAEQRWTLTTTGLLQHTASGMCVTPNGNGTANGTQIVLNTCTGGGSQIWATSGAGPTPPPTPTGEPTYDAATGTIVLQDNMDTKGTATDMGWVPNSPTPRIVPLPSPVSTSQPVDTVKNKVIAPGRGGAGKALRLSYSGAYQDASNWVTMNNAVMPNLSTHYITYWARVNFAAPITRQVAVKWFEGWHAVQGDSRVQWNTHDHLPWTGGSSTRTYWQVYDGNATTTSQGTQPVGPYFEGLADNQWHRFTYEYRPNTSVVSGSRATNNLVTSRDGVSRMWIDGVKVIDISAAAVGVTPAGGEKVWCNMDDLDNVFVNDGISSLRWGSTQTNGPGQATVPQTLFVPWTLDIDDFVWWVKR